MATTQRMFGLELSAKQSVDLAAVQLDAQARNKALLPYGTNPTIEDAVAAGLSLGIEPLVRRRQARKAYEKQVALTAEAVQTQQRRELANEINQQRSMARARGLELMFKTGMLEAPVFKQWR